MPYCLIKASKEYYNKKVIGYAVFFIVLIESVSATWVAVTLTDTWIECGW